MELKTVEAAQQTSPQGKVGECSKGESLLVTQWKYHHLLVTQWKYHHHPLQDDSSENEGML